MIATNQTRRATIPARSAIAAMVMVVSVAATGTAWPQAAPPTGASPAAPPPVPPAAPAPPENPGLINEIGKLLAKPSSLLPSFGASKPAEPPAPPSAEPPAAPAAPEPPAAKPAAPAETPSLFAVPSMVTGRATCPVSANGAPDCKAAAVNLCAGKGYKDGKSLATDTVEKCSAKLLIPGRPRQPGDCKTENYVTRALCQ